MTFFPFHFNFSSPSLRFILIRHFFEQGSNFWGRETGVEKKRFLNTGSIKKHLKFLTGGFEPPNPLEIAAPIFLTGLLCYERSDKIIITAKVD